MAIVQGTVHVGGTATVAADSELATLGEDQLAIADLLIAIGAAQEDVTAAEVSMARHATSTDAEDFFTALCSDTIIGRLASEANTAPSCILLDRTDGTEGASIVQIVVGNPSQMAAIVQGANGTLA